MHKFKRIKGTQDILPEQAIHWQHLEAVVRNCMHLYNYQELRTPIFERTELFARGIGQATDIVSKEMYTFQDRGKKSLTLKPEMTAPIVRAYLENNLSTKSPLSKVYYIAPLFRQENPQAGRLRQFNQFGAEAIGSISPELDVELILLALKIYETLNIANLKLVINSVGDPTSRDSYKNQLKAYVKPLLNQYCPECHRRFMNNPLRILDCKNESCKSLNQKAPKLIDHLNENSRNHFDLVQKCLVLNKISFEVNPYLVRGLDYYTHTVFEIIGQELGAQDAICGGGRYDLLAEQLGGPAVPAVGFASGIERLLMVMEAQSLLRQQEARLDIFMVPLGEEASIVTAKWVEKLRKLGFKTDRDYLSRSVKAQMREANRLQAKLVLLLGEHELNKKEFTVKEMDSGKQNTVSFTKLESYMNQFFADDRSKSK